MPGLTPACITGAVFAMSYTAFAVYVIRSDRRAPGGFFRGLGSALSVLPVTAVVERSGGHLDYRNNLHMSLSVLLTSALIYAVGFALGAALDALFAVILH